MKLKILLSLALVVGAVLLGEVTQSQQAGEKTPLSLSIAFLDSPFDHEMHVDIHTNFHFHVIIANTSEKPENLLKERCSSGFGALFFELTDEKGGKYLISRRARAWRSNGLPFWILKTGEIYVKDVCFAQVYQEQDAWVGFPQQLNHEDGTLFEMKAIFELVPPGTPWGVPLWHGRIESRPVRCRIRDIRSMSVGPSSYGESFSTAIINGKVAPTARLHYSQ
jgi:hypothetical protein